MGGSQNTRRRAHANSHWKVPTQLGFEPRNPLSVRYHPGKHKPGNPTLAVSEMNYKHTTYQGCHGNLCSQYHSIPWWNGDTHFFKTHKNWCIRTNSTALLVLLFLKVTRVAFGTWLTRSTANLRSFLTQRWWSATVAHPPVDHFDLAILKGRSQSVAPTRERMATAAAV